MSGLTKGAAARILELFPTVTFTHCASLCLNICIVKCCSMCATQLSMEITDIVFACSPTIHLNASYSISREQEKGATLMLLSWKGLLIRLLRATCVEWNFRAAEDAD